MRYFIFSILAFFCVTSVCAQDKILLSKSVSEKNILIDKSHLKWIETPYDFDQEKLSIPEIDKKIDSIIDLQKNLNVENIQTPINLKRLKYYGYRDFESIGVIEDSKAFNNKNNLPIFKEALGPKNIFSYNNIFVVSTYNSKEDEFTVYSIIRAFHILKVKYPEIYETLIVNSEKSPLLNPKLNIDLAGFENINSNNKYAFIIHEDENLIENTTSTWFNNGYKNSFNDKLTYDNNVHFIKLNKNTIRNGGVYNLSKKIYPGDNLLFSQVRFLLDGLLQTIIHERMHNYISNNLNLSSFLYFIRNDKSLIIGENGDKSTYKYQEEPIVTNTVNNILKKYGGISIEISNYYDHLFKENQLPKLKKYTKYNKLLEKLRTLKNVESLDINEILVLKM